MSPELDSERVNRLVPIAIELQQLGVSQSGVRELLSQYPPEIIERQLRYLPYRKKPKRPSAFIVDAIRNNYSPPNTYPHASTSDHRL